MHIGYSTMIRATQFCIAMATLSALVGAAPAPSVSIVVSAPRPSILAGEPLFLTLTLKNMSTEKLLLRSDPDSFARVRSEERRVGKECRSRWARDHSKRK